MKSFTDAILVAADGPTVDVGVQLQAFQTVWGALSDGLFELRMDLARCGQLEFPQRELIDLNQKAALLSVWMESIAAEMVDLQKDYGVSRKKLQTAH